MQISRGSVSTSRSTSTSSPAATPARSRFSALTLIRNLSPRGATVLRYVYPAIVTRTVAHQAIAVPRS
jgi:hypothetical protein